MADLTDIKQRLIGRWQTGYARAGQRLEDELRATSPVDTGRMQSQTRVFPRGPLTLEVVVGTPYASFVRDGTSPHMIEPIPPRRALRWESDGRVFFRRRVNHPGSQPNAWYRSAVARMAEFVEAEFERLP